MQAPLLSLILILYPITLLTLFLSIIPLRPKSLLICRLNRWAGGIEYCLSPLRDRLLPPLCLFIFIAATFSNLLTAITTQSLSSLPASLPYDGLIVLFTYYAKRHHDDERLRHIEFSRTHPDIHPQDFFDHLYHCLGPFGATLYLQETRAVSPHGLSFLTTPSAFRSITPVLHGLWDTATLAHLCLLAMTRLGPHYAKEIFDIMASMWGKRSLQLFGASLHTTGIEHLQGLEGKITLVFTHHSHLDFVFSFFALSSIRLANHRPLRIRFVVAKDHFKDNRFVYHILGIGKLIEAVGMVFVDRKTKGKGQEALRQGARACATADMELAIYPQGTRARPAGDLSPTQYRDCYYTTFSSTHATHPHGHLRPGITQFAETLADALPDTQLIHFVPVGISGTGRICPSGSIQVASGYPIDYTIGKPLSYTARDVRTYDTPRLLAEIDTALATTAGYTDKLLNEFLRTHHLDDVIEKNIPPHIKKTLYPLIDRLYALPKELQAPILSQLTNSLNDQTLTETDRDISLTKLLQVVSEAYKTACTNQERRESRRSANASPARLNVSTSTKMPSPDITAR